MMPGPWDKYRSSTTAPQGGVIIGRADPSVAHADRRADATQAMDRERLEIARRTAEQEARLRDINIQIAKNKLSQGDGALPPPPGDVNKTGDEYIATLPRGMAPTIKSVLEGRQAPPSSFALSKPYWQQIMSAANQADPSFDQSQWQARVQLRKQYESQASRTPGAVINSVNTLAAHANSMWKNHLQMAGPNLGPLSGTAAGIMQGFDQKNTPAYNTEIGFVQGELQKLISQGQSNQAEADRILHNLRSAQSYSARTEAIKALVEMAQGKIQPLHDGWTSVMGDLPMPTDITPSSRAVFDNILTEGKQALKVDQNGTPIVPGSIADKRDDRPWDVPGGNGSPPGGGPGRGGPPPAGGDVNRTSTFIDNTPVDQRGTASASTAQYVAEDDPKTAAIVDHWIRMGKSGAEINAELDRLGLHGATVDPAQVTLAQNYLRTPAGRNYNHNLASATRQVEQTPLERAGNIMGLSKPGSFAIGAYDGLNSLSFGNIGAASDAITGLPGQSELAVQAAGQAHPFYKGAGEMVGTLPAFAGAEYGFAKMAARGIGSSPVAAALASPLTADAASGAYIGAGSNPNDRISGALFGGVTGAAGGAVGRNLVAPALAAAARSTPGSIVANALLRSRGLPEVVAPPKPSVAEALLARTANKAGVDGISDQLAQAQRLGVPMSLADTDQGFSSLAGGAVRRSPTAAQMAENALNPRSLSQIDRLGSAVTRDLGPIENIPQLSADMTAHARAVAGPLYDAAYARSVPGTPELAATLDTPFGRTALGRAQTIAANERRSPTELGFSQDAQGNTILNPQPNRQIANHLAARAELDDAQNAYRLARNGTGDMEAARARVEQAREGVRQAEQGLNTSNDPMMPANGQNYTTQTLDYVKRGMDDVLEQQRNPITGRLVLDEAGRAQNGVRQQFLSEVDRHNPAYQDARNAYAGPAQSRDAMVRGQDAYSLDPNELGMQVASQTPEHLEQMQLGYRSELMNRANGVSDGRNPFEVTLGNPNARSRLETLYPDNPGVADLLAQRDMEAQLARTKTDVIGGSQTARRTIADRAFDLATAPSLALDAGMISMGHPPVATAAVLGAKGAKTVIQSLIEKGAVEKADAIAPLLLNTDPSASARILRSLIDTTQTYQDYVRTHNRNLGVPLGVVGASTGSATISN